MKQLLSRLKRKNNRAKQKGAALIITLLVLLIVVLLSLSLLVQSDTEYLMAINEQDAADAFQYAEAGLSWAKQEILDYIEGAATFTDLLNGADNASASDDYLIPLRTIDASLTSTDELVAANEQASSLIVTMNFGDGNKTYEAFRWGMDTDGDTVWDGPRALIYVRIDDNYDDGVSNDPLVDTDQRISATVVAEYPIFVDAGGVIQTGTRTVARRHLVAKFGVDNIQAAIIADKNIRINGNPKVCGECGSIHANGRMDVPGNPRICENLTSVTSYTAGGSPDVDGDEGAGFPEIPVPTINPYDDIYVPVPSEFAGISYTGCGSSTPKYFALVPSLNGSGKGLIFKAYWTNTAREANNSGGWQWRLIDDLNDGSNTMLDNCGRVVSGSVGGVSLGLDSGAVAGSGVNDTKDDEFYGFKLAGTNVLTENCSGDDSLCSTCDLSENDFNSVDYYNTSNTLVNNANHPVLPGSFDPDGVRDFANNKLKEGDPKWDKSSDVIYSPVYNAVIWVYGELTISGNPSISSCNSNGTSTVCGVVPPDGLWRASFIAVGNIRVSGNPKYAPANAAGGYHFLLISGRDIEVSGNATGSNTKCGPSGSTCTIQAGNSTEYAGIIAAHEQVKLNGNPTFDGFIVIEDAVDCATAHTRSGSPAYFDFSGNPEIHYDCVNPPNPWASKVSMQSWQEVP